VEAEYRQDPELIAGTVVRIGSTIYDGSVRTRIEKLRHQLAFQ
jgi:F-type H+-transporting ATPase subunit delta